MTGTLPIRDIALVQAKLAWMREQRIWPNGLRYLWTDGFGVVLLVSLWMELHDDRYLREAEWVVAEVDRVLGRPRGIRIGEEPDRDGQYFHYFAMWLFALGRLGVIDARYREKAIALVREIHQAFVIPGTGVIWKMREDLSGPYPGFGLGALDAFHGLVVYRLLNPIGLAPQIGQMQALVEASYPHLRITQDLLRGVARPAGGIGAAGSGQSDQLLLRRLSLRRRIRLQRHHPRYGLHLPLPGAVSQIGLVPGNQCNGSQDGARL